MRINFFCIAIAYALGFQMSYAQALNVDSVKQLLKTGKHDTSEVSSLATLVNYYNRYDPNTAMKYVVQMIELSQQIKYSYGEAWGYALMATTLDRGGNFSHSYDNAVKCLKLAEKLPQGKEWLMSLAYTQMGLLERLNGRIEESLRNLYEALALAKASRKPESSYYQIYTHLAYSLLGAKKVDSAQIFGETGYNIALRSQNKVFLPYACNILGGVYEAKNENAKAMSFYRQGINASKLVNHMFQMSFISNNIASLYFKEGQTDSAIFYAKSSLNLSKQYLFGLPFLQASNSLTRIYESQNQSDSVLKYLQMVLLVKDSIFSQARTQQFQLLSFEESQRQQQLHLTETAYRNKVITYGLSFFLLLLLITAIILLRNNRQKQKANLLLDQQKKDLQDTLAELKTTQTQLIQSEKMASLGELTAGIAHEIQNPLNFVNNFSDINKELIDELETEIANGNLPEAKKIARDIVSNEEKINEHGKRADSIVKSMLQHSRTHTGQKEMTDINALCDEYLKLSYHGMRAKDKAFNVTMKTDYDSHAGKINIIPQDIGRVLLNVYNNAFYAVTEKKLTQPNFEPYISVSTRRNGTKVEIEVRDNGIGISPEIQDKIFQPFFTTKPTGQGTGLGLSLSYDIVKKGHNGDVTMESTPKEGSVFKIILSTN